MTEPKLIENERLFTTDDKKVINWNGENYYLACGVEVVRDSEGATTCVKRVGHPTDIHEDYNGRTIDRSLADYHFEDCGIEEAISRAVNVATRFHRGGFDNDELENISRQLQSRILQVTKHG